MDGGQEGQVKGWEKGGQGGSTAKKSREKGQIGKNRIG
jgi:hypothetical protein